MVKSWYWLESPILIYSVHNISVGFHSYVMALFMYDVNFDFVSPDLLGFGDRYTFPDFLIS